MKTTLFYSEGAGTTRFSVGEFATMEKAIEFADTFGNFHAVWEFVQYGAEVA